MNYVLNRVWKKLFAIGRLLPLPSKVTAKLYKSFILPYCDVIWSPHLSRHINYLERAHQRVIKMIGDASYSLPSTFVYSNYITGRCNRNAHRQNIFLLYIITLVRTVFNILVLLFGIHWIILYNYSSSNINNFKQLYKSLYFKPSLSCD